MPGFGSRQDYTRLLTQRSIFAEIPLRLLRSAALCFFKPIPRDSPKLTTILLRRRFLNGRLALKLPRFLSNE